MWKLIYAVKNWHFNEEKFAALGKEKFGLLKQIKSLFFMAIPLLFIIVIVNVTFFLFPLIPAILIPACLLAFCVFLFLAHRASSFEQRDVLWSKAKIFSNLLYVIWGGVFFFGLMCWFGSILLHIPIPTTKCLFPLSVPEKIVTDNKGQIYCISRFYNRLQVFGSRGQFLRGWFINLPAGRYNISIDPEGNVCLFAKNNRKGYKYNSSGKRIGEVGNPYFAEKYQLEQLTKTENSLGYAYDIQNPFFLPGIVKTSDSGQESLLYRQPFGLWLVTMPIPGFVFFMMLLITEKSISKRIKSNR